jgi:hypothetical protein
MLRLLSAVTAILLSVIPSVFACEGCKEPSNVAGASGVGGISAGFSWSVIFMLGAVASVLGGLVWMMVRSCKQLHAGHQAATTIGRAGSSS